MKYETLREIKHSIPDHQLLLSFVNDEDCWTFEEWWIEKGQRLFEQYLEEL
jgi:hypothetical protein